MIDYTKHLIPGQILRTRSGVNHTGNAIVLGPGRKPGLFKIKTDFGNVVDSINADEIRSMFQLGELTDLAQWQADRVRLLNEGFD